MLPTDLILSGNMRRAKQEEYWSGSSMMGFKTGPGVVWVIAVDALRTAFLQHISTWVCYGFLWGGMLDEIWGHKEEKAHEAEVRTCKNEVIDTQSRICMCKHVLELSHSLLFSCMKSIVWGGVNMHYNSYYVCDVTDLWCGVRRSGHLYSSLSSLESCYWWCPG